MIKWAHVLPADSRHESAGSPGNPASWTLVRSGGPGAGPPPAMGGLQRVLDAEVHFTVLEELVLPWLPMDLRTVALPGRQGMRLKRLIFLFFISAPQEMPHPSHVHQT